MTCKCNLQANIENTNNVIYNYALSCAVDGPEEHSSKLLSTPFVEDPGHRLKWTAHLEFTHNHEVGDLTWDKVRVRVRVHISNAQSVRMFYLSLLWQ